MTWGQCTSGVGPDPQKCVCLFVCSLWGSTRMSNSITAYIYMHACAPPLPHSLSAVWGSTEMCLGLDSNLPRPDIPMSATYKF